MQKKRLAGEREESCTARKEDRWELKKEKEESKSL
jgi:hypothetical protein